MIGLKKKKTKERKKEKEKTDRERERDVFLLIALYMYYLHFTVSTVFLCILPPILKLTLTDISFFFFHFFKSFNRKK
jgi:hypothetical protein